MTDPKELKHDFISILTKGRKDNTYKFALARFLLEHSQNCEPDFIEKKIANNEKQIVSYQEIANMFLKYYWHQECKYRIKQNHNDAKPPSVITTIRTVFGEEYIPHSFESMEPKKKSDSTEGNQGEGLWKRKAKDIASNPTLSKHNGRKQSKKKGDILRK